MSISLSVYDVFANMIPGLFYVVAINEFLKFIGIKTIDPASLTSTPQTLTLLGVAYILGHLFNAFTYKWWYLLFYREGTHPDRNSYKSDSGKAIDTLRRQYPDLDFKSFYPRDSDILFNAIQIKDKALADRIEITRVSAIMMRNVSFGLFLLGIVQVIHAIMDQSIIFGLLAFTCFIGSSLALSQTSKYYYWFFKDVFRISSLHGNSLRNVVENLRGENPQKNKTKSK